MKQDVRKLAGGGGVLLVATLAGNALLLGLDVFLNHALAPEDYGSFGALRRVLQLATFGVLLGMENAIVRAVAAEPPAEAARTTRTALTWTLAASLVAALIGGGAAPWVSGWLHISPWAWGIALASLPLAAARMVGVAAAQGAGRMLPRAAVMFGLWPLAQGALALALVGWERGEGTSVGAAWSYTGAMGIGAVAALAWAWPQLKGAAALPPAATRAKAAALWAFSWPLWLQSLLMGAYTWLDHILLTGLSTPAAAAAYGPAAAISPLFGLGLGALNGRFAPMIAAHHAAGRVHELQSLYQTVTRWAVALSLPPVALALVAPQSVLCLWPSAPPEAAHALQILAAGQLLCTSVGSVNYLLIMSGHQRLTLWNAIPATAASLLVSLWLTPQLGATGAALANLTATGLANGVALLQVWRALKIHPFGAGLFKLLLAVLPMAALVAGLQAAGLAGVWLLGVGGGLGGIVFLGAAAALGLEEADRDLLAALLRRLRWRAAL